MGMSLERYFALTLKTARKKANLTQTQLADLCGLERAFISMLERGARKPSLESFMVIAKELNVTPSTFLLELEGRMNFPEPSANNKP
jgi:transcriptional regulator with XRE-family HTH domain